VSRASGGNSIWRIVERDGRLELHRGNSIVPYRTWALEDRAIAYAARDILNIVQTEIV